MAYQAVLDALESRDLLKGGWGESKLALCPAHDDNTPSLSVKEGDDGKALVYCHAGCDVREVTESLGLTVSDLFRGSADGAVVDTYIYTDEEGGPLYRVVRLSPKGFFQERWEDDEWKPGLREVRRVLYRLPEVIASVDQPLYITEGEKDADALTRLGLAATTILGGAPAKWRDEYAEFFVNREVIIVGDNDDPGRASADSLRMQIEGIAASVSVRYPRVGKDVSDHLLSGLGVGDLVAEDGGLDEFGPLDWDTYEVPETEWLFEPYIPRAGRVLAYGPRGSLKSLWAMWVAGHVAREGGKVAYFSLEMLPSDSVRRVKQLDPPKDRFFLFTRNLKLGSPSQLNKLIAGLKGFDLIVVDSWTAAQQLGQGSNEAVAALDAEWTLPLINETGAAVVFIDNTGHDAITDNGKVKADHARGASAKGDKVEVELWFRRPDDSNNYRTTLTVNKMRLDYPIPPPMMMETPQDRIEFYLVDSLSGMRTGTPCWPNLRVIGAANASSNEDSLAASVKTKTTSVAPSEQDDGGKRQSMSHPSPSPRKIESDSGESSTNSESNTEVNASTPTPESMNPGEMTPAERRALARLKDKFKAADLTATAPNAEETSGE